MFFETNLQALLQSNDAHLPLVQRLRETEATNACQVFNAANGTYTLAYQDVFLHHPENPLKEVHETLAANCQAGYDRLHVILGLGMGYLLQETFNHSQGHIVVYERDLSLLRFLLENINFAPLFSSGRVWLVDNPIDLLTQIRYKLYRQYQLDILILRGYAHLLGDQIPEIMKRITEVETDRVYDAKTGRAFHFQWLQQFLTNLPDFATMGTLDELSDLFKGKPALVISRGPSLDQSLESLRAAQDSAILIAVGGALHRLYNSGIIPDFAVFYDANGMQEQLHGLPEFYLSQITFLLSPFTQRCAFETPSQGRLLFLGQSNGQFADWLDMALGKAHSRIDGGGSVSIIGFQVAMAMGCNPITLVGQDLAFPNNQVYAGGIELQQDEQGCMALTPTETLYAKPVTMDTVMGQNGETMQTLKSYAGFIRHFQDLAVKNAQGTNPITLYNASLGGAHLEGFLLKALPQITQDFPVAWKDSDTLAQILNATGKQVEARQLALGKALLDLKQDFQQMIPLIQQLSQVLQDKSILPQQSLALIQSANRQFVNAIDAHPFVGYWLMYELIDFRTKISQMSSTAEFIAEGTPTLLQMLDNCQAIMQQKALPWVEKTYQTISMARHKAGTLTGYESNPG